jgi:hypothetical protein
MSYLLLAALAIAAETPMESRIAAVIAERFLNRAREAVVLHFVPIYALLRRRHNRELR